MLVSKHELNELLILPKKAKKLNQKIYGLQATVAYSQSRDHDCFHRNYME